MRVGMYFVNALKEELRALLLRRTRRHRRCSNGVGIYSMHDTKQEDRYDHKNPCEYDEVIKILLRENGDEGSSCGWANQQRNPDTEKDSAQPRSKLFDWGDGRNICRQ